MTPDQWRRSAAAADNRASTKENPATAQQRPTRRRLNIIASMAADARADRTRARIYRGLARAIEARHPGPFPESPRAIRTGSDSPDLVWAAYDDSTAIPAAPTGPDKAELWRAAQAEYPGYFPTPADVADLAARCLDLGPDVRNVWEPSAGSGDLILAVLRNFPNWSGSIRGDETNRTLAQLAARRLEAYDSTGTGSITAEVFVSDMYLNDRKYDAILMNPPFERGEDAAQVFRVCHHNAAPGARVVAIMSPHWTFADSNPARTLKRWLAESADAYSWFPDWTALGLNRSAAFSASLRSTNVNTGLLVVDIRR